MQAELPEWADDTFEVVDITDMNPMPTVGIEYSNGAFIFPAEAVKTPEEIFTDTKAKYNKAVEDFIISVAQSKGYRDDVACVGYVSDPYPTFANEANSFVAWRSQVWQRCFSDLSYIQSGTMAMPISTQDYILTLPQLPVGW
jgi:hypothetical protein